MTKLYKFFYINIVNKFAIKKSFLSTFYQFINKISEFFLEFKKIYMIFIITRTKI